MNMDSKESVEEHGFEPNIGSESILNVTSESQEEQKDSTKDNNQSSEERISPEPSCAICLGKPENKSFTDSCFHTFCFACLVEWSKIKAECPLCKQSFRSIIHNVRSLEDYDQYLINVQNVPSNLPSDNSSRRFRYSSTLTVERRQQIHFERSLEFHNYRSTYAPHVTPQSVRRNRGHHISTSNFRRHVYESGLWVQPLVDGQTGRFRDTSPEFYRQNPACTHRLIPWLNRELLALLGDGGESQLAFLLELILALIMRYDIRSPEFFEHVHPFFRDHTNHFVHEFFNFARSPYDLVTFDRRAVYDITEPRKEKDSESDSSESDIDVVSINPQESKPFFPTSIRNGTSESFSNQNFHSDPLAVGNVPGVSSLGSFYMQATANSSQTLNHMEANKVQVIEDSDSSSDCVVVAYIKPKVERTPELVDIASTSGDEQDLKSKFLKDISLENSRSTGQNSPKEKPKSYKSSRSRRSRSYRKSRRRNGRHSSSSSRKSSLYRSSSSEISSRRWNSSRHNTCGSSTQSPTPSLGRHFRGRSRSEHSLSPKKVTAGDSENSGTYSLSFRKKGEQRLKSLVISVRKNDSYSGEHKGKHYRSKHKRKHKKSKKHKFRDHHYHQYSSSSYSD
ncbi:E3 ubiquitin-protein ligase Topors-like isoform X2 [Limulus polyphemus]|nr:E3 ubiquitin-protein ligase Topors-like isoform X2 [Limulus polyphemus]XP_022251297.1 E3 ubiquitin-protein ligase Topors-like isoform X2 [Limulus polyphemus]